VILLELLDDIQSVATDMADGDLGGFGVFMRDFHQFLAPFLVQLRDPQAQHLAFGGGRQAEVGIDDRLFDRLHHRLVPHLHGQQARLRHADGGELVKRHVRAVSLDLHRLQHGRRRAAGAQAAQFVLERVGGALHAALQFVDVKTGRGHNALPSLETSRRHLKSPRFEAALAISAGNHRAMAGPAQDRADRTRLGDREYDDRQ
jgi:hypothetical protein